MLLALITYYAVVESGLISQPSVESEFVFYTDRIRIIYNLLAEECPDWRQEEAAFKRNMVSSHHLDVEIRLYNELMKELIKCRNGNSLKSSTQPQTTPYIPATTEPTTTEPTTTEPAATEPTTTEPTTTATSTTTETVELLPTECRNAVNLTGSWRLDHSAQDLKAGGPHNFRGYACDLHTTDWFRISGDGGSRILNKCAPRYSCGTNYPMWTNGAIPDTVGERVESRFYWSCSTSVPTSAGLSVVRCSDHPNDLVYKQHYHKDRAFSGTCSGAFCGMN